MSTRECAIALQEGAKTAYKAVMKPTEGTMLTVARVTGEEAIKLSKKHQDFKSFSSEVIKVAKDTLDKTPDMLPPLKEAGVVDAGGMGVLYILMGAAQALDGTLDMGLIPISEEKITDTSPEIEIGADIRFAYCTEFL